MPTIQEVLKSYNEAKKKGCSSSDFCKERVTKPKISQKFISFDDLLINDESHIDYGHLNSRYSPNKAACAYCEEYAMKGSLEALIYLTKLKAAHALDSPGYVEGIKACLDQIKKDAPEKMERCLGGLLYLTQLMIADESYYGRTIESCLLKIKQGDPQKAFDLFKQCYPQASSEVFNNPSLEQPKSMSQANQSSSYIGQYS